MTRIHRLLAFTGLGAAFMLVDVSVGSAQVCAGFPTANGEASLGARVSFPTGGTSFGAEGSYNFANPLAAFAHFNLLVPDDEQDEENESIFGGGISYEISDRADWISGWLSVCPAAAASFSSVDGASTLTVPLGVGFGTTLDLGGPGLTLMPFVMPQFVLTRVSVEDVDVTDNDLGLGAGALVRWGNLYAGVTLGKIFSEGTDVDIAVRGGLTFGAP